MVSNAGKMGSAMPDDHNLELNFLGLKLCNATFSKIKMQYPNSSYNILSVNLSKNNFFYYKDR